MSFEWKKKHSKGSTNCMFPKRRFHIIPHEGGKMTPPEQISSGCLIRKQARGNIFCNYRYNRLMNSSIYLDH